MTHGVDVREVLLAEVDDGEECRRVTLIEGGSLGLMEQTSGPQTEAAYGSRGHAHKMLFGAEECLHALGATGGSPAEALVSLFSASDEVPLLSDVMDRFDQADVPYAYQSWVDGGDIALRGAAQGQ